MVQELVTLRGHLASLFGDLAERDLEGLNA
jgi:hypothetical protein